MPHRSECSYGYHFYSHLDFNTFSAGVRLGLFKSPKLFPPADSPVEDSILLGLITTMDSDYIGYEKGGSDQKQIYLTSKGFVMDAVNKIAPWVNTIANGDPKIIISAGYEATYSTPAQKGSTELAAPVDVKVETGKSTGLMSSECESFGINHFYGCIVSVGKPLLNVTMDLNGQLRFPANMDGAIIHDLSHNRKKNFAGLTKGVDYYFYWYVIGTGGVSQLSKVVVMTSI